MSEQASLEIGRGDGATTTFTCFLGRHPVVPGSLWISVIESDVVMRLGVLSDQSAAWTRIRGDVTGVLWEPSEDGKLIGAANQKPIGTVDHPSGHVHFTLPRAAPEGSSLVATWMWEPPRLRMCEVQVRLADGSTAWASLADLRDALFRGG